ncbi:MAG: penicillin-insensitive murein endopeptidase [Elusimicrobia bacterium]|nr:penicillin-insensitive murein endopeptidase [Elusimicrobiota bacterium]
MTRSSKVLAVAVGVALQLPAIQVTAAPASMILIRPRPPRRDLPRKLSPVEIMEAQLKTLVDKGPSLSMGRPYRKDAALLNPASLPLEGLGFWTIRPERNTHYGTDELIGGLIHTAAALKNADSAMQPLAVGDISGPNGGRVALHLSHRSGRDADLLFFWTNKRGTPVLTEEFVHFDAHGRARYMGQQIRFDVARNWRLVRTLLADERIGRPGVRIFVWKPLREILLAHARRFEEDRKVLRAATLALLPSKESDGLHNDHFHVRIACTARESALGCKD